MTIDYRSEIVKAYDEAFNTPQEVIDAHNQGVEFFYWMIDNKVDADAAKAEAPYDVEDQTEVGVAFWTGFGVTLLESIQNRMEMEALPRVLADINADDDE